MDDASTLGRPPGSADRGVLGDPVPCWHGALGRRSVPTVLPCPGPAVPPSRARCWPPSTWSLAVCFLAAEPNRTSWLTLAVGVVVVPAATGLSVLISRRREGATVGVLLGLLSLAVAHVVAKEIWLQWLATTDDPDRWVVAGRRHRRGRLVDPRDVRAAAAALPGRTGAVTSLALGPGDDGDRCGGHPGRTVRSSTSRSGHRWPTWTARSVRPRLGGSCSPWSRSWCCSCSSRPARCRWCCGSGAPTAPSASRSSGSRWPGSACRSTPCSACSRS